MQRFRRFILIFYYACLFFDFSFAQFNDQYDPNRSLSDRRFQQNGLVSDYNNNNNDANYNLNRDNSYRQPLTLEERGFGGTRVPPTNGNNDFNNRRFNNYDSYDVYNRTSLYNGADQNYNQRPNYNSNFAGNNDYLSNQNERNVFDRTPNRDVISNQNTVIFNRNGLMTGINNPLDYDYRYAPPTHRVGLNDEVYVISQERLRQIRSEFMYWYFDKGGDDDNGDYQTHIHNSNPQLHKNFNFQLPFFGFRFNYTRVSLHGFIEFSDPPAHYTYPLSFPNKNWPKENDHSFIGIFFSKCRIGSLRPTDIDRRRPGIYFRMERDLQSRTDRFGVEMRERLTWDIREGVVGAETFVPKHSVIITWKNVSFAGGIDNSLYTTNSFQMVLATDEVYTYAMYNYAEMQWTSHTEAGGDTTGGEGGVPAFVGFNAGNGTRSYDYYPYSQRSTLRDLVGRGWANGFPGRHIFRIDENIMLGTCNKDIAGTNLPLVFAPESGNMLGGTIVNITGPCFEPNMKIRCKFDTEEVIGRVVDRNRAICVQPFLTAEGYVIFDVAIGDDKYNWKGSYFVETPATATERIYFDTNAIHEVHSTEKIRMLWNRQNLTSNMDSRLKISLWGYRERSILPQLLHIDTIEENVPNTGSYTIDPDSYRERDNRDVLDIKFGFIQIVIQNPERYFSHAISPVLWSRPIPLGWYFSPQWEREYGVRWPEVLCDDWIRNDRYLKNFASELPQCPCTLEQALSDKGRYIPDRDCDLDANPKCYYHRGARHCVRSGVPSLEGSEQQCCYDKNNYVMFSYDQQWGSRPRRSHDLGYLPWSEANKVPSLSQWYHDISPFYMCCLWQEEQAVGCETFRFERRPSQDCTAYQSPYVATVFGDPHLITFDDLEYTFNGKGEFVLVHADTEKHKLDVQARFEQMPPNTYGPSMATELTSIAARDNSSTIIEVRKRPNHAQWRYRLDVFADGKRIYFDRSSLKLQHFRGVTVYTPSYILNQSEVIIMFESGAGVEVIENKGAMTARVYLPWKFINQTKGLLGSWTFDKSDDFMIPDGRIAMPNFNTFEDIHRLFGMSWLLEDRYEKDKGAALFFREYGRTASYYANRTFTPEWQKFADRILENKSLELSAANKLCGDSYQCKYDYAVTLNEDFARSTLKFQDAFVNIKSKNKDRIITCGVLETPRFGRKSNFLFTPGTKVTFECNENFVLIGDQRRICTAEGRWDVPQYGYTECLRLLEYESRNTWITIAIISFLVVPLLIILCCIVNFLYKRNQKDGSIGSWKYTSKPALRRRSSIVALSSLNLNDDNDNKLLRTSPSLLFDKNSSSTSSPMTTNDRTAMVPAVAGGGVSSNNSPLTSVTTVPSTTMASPISSSLSPDGSEGRKTKRNYDRVYRTREPLPGKPLIEFEDKVWDLDKEYMEADQKARKYYSLPSSSKKSSYPPTKQTTR